MNKLITSIFVALFSIACASGQNQAPAIQSMTLNVDSAAHSALIQFQLSDAENDSLEIIAQFSTDGGRSFRTLANNEVSGDVGFPVFSGNRQIACSGLNFSAAGKYVFRVVAKDRKPLDIQALVNEVDSIRLYNDLKTIEGVRHRTAGLAHLNATREMIQARFEDMGLYFENQVFPYTNTSGQNLIGSFAGVDSAKQVVISDAHYDTVSNAPGADDNGSGTVGMLEIARLLSRYPSSKTQRYIGFDLEESGLIGSIKYVSTGIPADELIEGVFNFEMIGYWSDQPNTQIVPAGFGVYFPLAVQAISNNQYRGDFITNVGNSNSVALELLFSTSAQQYVPDLKVITLNVPGNGQPNLTDLRRSDHTPFWDSSRKALMLTDGANFRNECYHTPGDTLDNKLNMHFMTNVVKATLASMAELSGAEHGSWAAATFEVNAASGTYAEPDCRVKVIPGNTLVLEAPDCFPAKMQVELFNLEGKRVGERSFSTQSGPVQFTPGINLPAGTYILRISSEAGSQSQKIFLGN